jgi:hypothetical protein
VAALFVAFGAFALQGSDTAKAGALPPLLVYPEGSNTPIASGGAVTSGTKVRIVANFGNNQAAADVTMGGTAGSSDLLLVPYPAAHAPYPATLYTTGLPNNNQDITPLVQDDNIGNADVYLVNASTMNAIGTNNDDNITLELTTTITCSTSGLTVTVTQNQALVFQDGTASLTFSFVCNIADPSVLSVKKVDQWGQLRPAAFAIQQQVFSNQWVTVATMQVGSAPSTNPCLSTGLCTTNPPGFTSGQLPPGPAGTGVTLPSGAYRVIEITTPATGANPTLCTLVEVRRATDPVAIALQPVDVTIPQTVSGFNTLTFVNSCAAPGGAVSATSAVQVVLGGSTQGLTNTTHLEIVPAPGSDDDARIDIRARDGNGINIQNAHVTVIIDKGALAMRTDTTGPSSPTNCPYNIQGVDPNAATSFVSGCFQPAGSGYEVIEPAPGNAFFGSNVAGDTCDQAGYYQLFATATQGLGSAPYFGNIGTPYFNNPSRRVQDGYTNTDGIISACVYVSSDADSGITPGKVNIQAIIETPGGAIPGLFPNLYSPFGSQNIVLTQTITVVGPPASVTVTAAPTSLLCGEKATITADVKDSIGQAVSDHTRVELVSNFGATIGGTGATLGFPGVGPVNPVSSSAAETFSGKATAFVLTSTEHVGPYEVVVTTGGSTGGYLTGTPNLGNWIGLNQPLGFLAQQGLSPVTGVYQLSNQVGAFSTAPVSAQVTVTCALPAAPVPVVQAPIAAPRTGEGIRPPNTGDAGLADASGGSSWALVIAGIVVAFAGVATLKFARR